MKHIKIRGELLPPDNDRVRVTIVEQTHFGKNFGDPTLNYGGRMLIGNSFVHGKVRLFAWNCGGFFTLDRAMGATLSVGFSEYRDKTSPSFLVSPEQWLGIKEAVIAYNEYYRSEP